MITHAFARKSKLRRSVGFAACILSITLGLACSLDPRDERPGLGLSGEVNRQPVRDWSFTSEIQEIFVETATPYFIPHSVTVWCVTLDNQLYVGAWAPDTKHWVANVRRNPNVRLKIGDRIYERRLEPITDSATIAKLDAAYARKYEYEEEEEAEEASTAHWRVVERG
ncbi:MAG: DUF2255 family protein [Deltaproteobacteria bacterium]|nr:DUF2255 family protein [Deltaproteobacteria bacterium]